MRTRFHHVAWTLAAVALVIATPVPVAADRGPMTTDSAPIVADRETRPRAVGGGTATAAARAPDITAFTVINPQPRDTGQGWSELYCMACVGLGTLALYSGGITMLPVILGNPAANGTLTGTCVLACESAIKTLLR
jgi:hypothetical protein